MAALDAQLAEVFEEFRVSQSGKRLIVEPRLRPDWLPEGNWRMLDVGDDAQEGVEVVQHVAAVLRKSDLTRGFERHKLTDSS